MCFHGHRHMGGEIKMISNLIQRNVYSAFDVPEVRDKTGLETFQKDIEKAYEIRRSTATGILQLLEKNGYLKRQSVSEDARLKKLVLTAKAIEVHDQIIARMEAFEKRFMSLFKELG